MFSSNNYNKSSFKTTTTSSTITSTTKSSSSVSINNHLTSYTPVYQKTSKIITTTRINNNSNSPNLQLTKFDNKTKNNSDRLEFLTTSNKLNVPIRKNDSSIGNKNVFDAQRIAAPTLRSVSYPATKLNAISSTRTVPITQLGYSNYSSTALSSSLPTKQLSSLPSIKPVVNIPSRNSPAKVVTKSTEQEQNNNGDKETGIFTKLFSFGKSPKQSTTTKTPEVDIKKVPISTPTTNQSIDKKFIATNQIQHRLKKGFAIIFNHETFKDNYQETRDGTQKDVDSLQKTFEKFKITVSVRNNFSLEEIKQEVKILKSFNFAPYDCFLLVILSHGGNNNMVCANDRSYSLNETIIDPIIGTNRTLAGKPKIIIIQACKGEKTPLHLQTDSIKISPEKSVIPVVVNLLFCFATYEGHLSYRNVNTGGIFIQKFCEILRKDGATKSILDIMVKVTKDVSSNKQICQVPMLQSTMTDPFIFGGIGN